MVAYRETALNISYKLESDLPCVRQHYMLSELLIDLERTKEASRCLKNIELTSFCEKRILFFLLT